MRAGVRGAAISLSASLIVLLGGLAMMSRYGVTFDAPGHMVLGDRTLFALTHASTPHAFDLLMPGEPAGFHPAFDRGPDWIFAAHVPVVVDLVCSLTSRVAHDGLGLLDLVDGHHLGLILTYAITLGFYAAYVCRLSGRAAAIAATVALLLFPSAIGHAFNNQKDWPCAMFYALGMLAFGHGALEGRRRTLLAASFWFALAASAKLNGAFAPISAVLWYVSGPTRHARAAGSRWRGLAEVGLLVALATILFVALWPWLWWDGPAALVGRLRHFVGQYWGYGVTSRPHWWPYPFRCVLYTTPPVILMLASGFVVSGWRGSPRDRAIWGLLVVWMAVPLVRIAMPHVNVYDMNRQFIEYVPAMCAMAGIAVTALARSFLRTRRSRLGRTPRLAAAWLAGVLLVAGLAWPAAQYHPFEAAYFNVFAGGLGGAQRDALLREPRGYPWPDWATAGAEGDYWFSSLRDATREVVQLAGPDASLAICGSWVGQVRANAPPGTRLQVSSWDGTDFDVLYASPREPFCGWNVIRSLEQTRRVLRRVERDGGLVYEIFGAPLQTPVPPRSPESWYSRHSCATTR